MDFDYKELLKHPKWQKKRLEILARDEFQCKLCSDEETTLHIHHLKYEYGNKPWEYEDKYLITICKDCHKVIHSLQDSELDFDWNVKSIEVRKRKYKDRLPVIFVLTKSGYLIMCNAETGRIQPISPSTIGIMLELISKSKGIKL